VCHIRGFENAKSIDICKMGKEEADRLRWKVHDLLLNHMSSGTFDMISKAASSGNCLAKVRLGLLL
jgi:hypothetical protein